MFKSRLFILSVAGICLSGCSSNANTDMSQMTFQQIDAVNFAISIPVSYDAKNGDSSYLRQLHRQQITLKFIQEHYCSRGITIKSPHIQGSSSGHYILQYPVECKSQARVS